MANEQNLKPFKKGYDKRREGNGRKKWPDLKEAIEDIDGDGLKSVLKALHTQAKNGNVRAIQEILDRYYGKPKQDIGISGEVGITWNEVKTYENDSNS